MSNTVVNLIVFGIAAVILAYFLWDMWTASRTYRQRSEMLARVAPGSELAADQIAIIGSISYAQHKGALFRFSNPRALYADRVSAMPRLVAALEIIWPKGERL